MVKGRKAESVPRGRITIGIAATLALLVLAIAPLLSPKVAVDEGAEHGNERAQSSAAADHDSHAADETIRGYMTLSDLEAATGVSAVAIRSALGLPEDVSTDERIRHLGDTYGFDMVRVRDVIAGLQ